MGWEGWLTAAVVAAVVAVLARDWAAPAPTVLGGVVVLLVAGVVDAGAAFAGFSNPAPITVAALYVVARAVEVSGGLEPLVARVLGEAGSHRGQLARVVAPTAGASAVLNNTPIVAMLAPTVADWADRHGLPPSRYLIPLSFAAVLGGVVTTIGTSTNLVVSGLLEEAGRAPLGLFELSRVGLPVAVAGCAVLVWLAPRLLPDRRGARETFADSVRQFTVSMRVLGGGPLDGKSVEDGGLRALEGVYCVQIDRDGQTIAPVAPTEVLRGGDELTFVGNVGRVVDLQHNRGLASTEAHHLERLPGAEQTFFEAVVGENSPLVGQSLKEVGFRGRYQAAVVGIHRAGQRVEDKLGEVRLRLGDTLLLLADRGFKARWAETGDFLLIAPLGAEPPEAPGRKAVATAAILIGLVVVAGVGWLPILHASLAAALLLVAAGVLTPRQARGAVDLDVIIVIAAAFGLGAAVADSGLAGVLAGGLLDVFAPLGPVGALAGVLLATMVLTELITNNAAAVLVFPIAAATAAGVGADPRPFAIAVAVGASLSFLTPIGYQTNLMVYGLGGYRFTDFARLGVPLNVVVIALTLTIIPLAWPL